KAKHDLVNFKLRAHYDTKRAFAELRAGNIDLMIVLEEEFDHDDFNVEILRDEEIIMVCNNKHPLAGQKDLSLEQVMNEIFILTEPDCGYRAVITQEMMKLNYKLAPNMWFENTEAIKQCVMSNMGLSFLPRIACQADISCGAMKQVQLTQKFNKEIKLQIVTHKDKWLSPTLSAFIDELKNRFRVQ
ncbi:MAG: hypothetical protein HOH19_10835, partial [Kordiimonadaceae bacterium]|nr:hypothetical protein [Kordiimonadaceae bacterium]